MVICFNCSQKTKEFLDSLLESGQYSDYSEIISFAVENLAVLQGEVIKKGALIIGEDNSVSAERFKANVPTATRLSPEVSLAKTNKRKGQKTSQAKESSIKKDFFIPSIFQLDGVGDSCPQLAGLPSDIWATGQEVPLDRWIFGQYNKMLPTKANCRALAHLLKDQPKGLPINQAASHIAEEAAALGDFLSHHDEKNNIGRDDALSTAFPSTGTGAEKGRLRYANQFVASVNKQGQVSGLLIDLKLVNRTSGKEPRLLLTEAGWRFASIGNPILDGSQETPTQKFTTEEIEFFLDHLARSVPAEDFAYRTILSAILNGKISPEQLDSELQRYAPQDPGRNLSKSFLASQRSGAISRMADLGLVARDRRGVKVTYIATDSGNQYVRRTR